MSIISKAKSLMEAQYYVKLTLESSLSRNIYQSRQLSPQGLAFDHGEMVKYSLKLFAQLAV
jgi:hypothetical protein